MRFALVLFGLLLVLVSPAEAGKSPPKVILDIYVQTAGEGLSANEAQTVLLPPNGEPIQIRALPEVTSRNLVAVTSSPNGTLLLFDHQGQVNLNAVTGQNQGRIMVVMLNGYIIYSPLIDEEITNGQLLLPHPLPAQIVTLLEDEAKKNLRK